MAGRSRPPYSSGQVMPSQPRSPSLRENSGSTPASQVSTCVVKVPAASSAARNSRTSRRTCSAASDLGAGARVRVLLLLTSGLPTSAGFPPSVLQQPQGAPPGGRRTSHRVRLRNSDRSSCGSAAPGAPRPRSGAPSLLLGRGEREHRAGPQALQRGTVQAEGGTQPDGGVHPRQTLL